MSQLASAFSPAAETNSAAMTICRSPTSAILTAHPGWVMRPHPPGVDGGRGSLRLHTDIPTRSEIERLLAARDPCCVSAYLPTSPITQDAQADRIELKNLVSATRPVRWMRRAPTEPPSRGDARGAGRPRRRRRFGTQQARSLAVFASPAGLRTFRLPNRLTRRGGGGGPLVRQAAAAGGHLPAGGVRARAGCRLRAARRDRLAKGRRSPSPSAGLPADAASAARKASIADRSPSARLQGSEGQKVRFRQFARKVDQALRGESPGLELPLILAAAEPLGSIYRGEQLSAISSSRASPAIRRRRATRTWPQRRATVLDEVYAAELAGVRDVYELRSARARPRPTWSRWRARRPRARSTRCSSTSTRRCPATSTDSGAVTFARTTR